MPYGRQKQRHAMSLIVVLVIVPVLAYVTLSFAQLMLTEDAGSRFVLRQSQVRLAVQSAVEMLRVWFMQEEDLRIEAGGDYDNPAVFAGQVVVDDLEMRDRVCFTVVSPRWQDYQPVGIRYGLEDESGKINLNALFALAKKADVDARDILLKLPSMDEMTADAILDWLDEDDNPRTYGAELEYYTTLEQPYRPRNGPIQTIEELLLVRGVTPALLFGADLNRNGLTDTGEPDPTTMDDVDNSTGAMTCGWAAYLTLWSMESNARPDGTAKINLNDNNLENLYGELASIFDPSWADYIVAYRQYSGDADNPVRVRADGSVDPSQRARRQIENILDLIGGEIPVQREGSNQRATMPSPFSDDPDEMRTYLPELLDNVTTDSESVIVGRININVAPRAVLECLPELDADAVERIIASRYEEPVNRPQEHRHAAWILWEGIVSLEQMKKLMPLVTGQGGVYRAQIVGFYGNGSPFARVEVVVDATKQPAAILFWRDVSHLGMGFSLEWLLGTSY